MSIPILQPRLILGLQTGIRGNAQFITDEEIVYPVGGVLAIHNFTQKKQRLIKLPEKGQNVTAVVVSPSKKIIAIVEKGERPSVTLFDSSTHKKKRTLLIPPDREVLAKDIVAASFTFDSKCFIIVTGDPDWSMFVFRCDKGKMESSTRANNSNGTGQVVQVACNPNDSNLIVLVGNQLLRLLACTENVWRQFGYSKADMLNLRCVAWLSQDRFLTGTHDGRLFMVENGDLKAVLWANDLPFMNFKVKDDMQQTSQTSISIPSISSSLPEGEDYEIRSIFTFPKGLAFGYLNGTIHFYEKETNHKYQKRNVFKIPDHNLDRDDGDPEFVMNKVNCIDINVSQDRLLASCEETQLYSVKLWGADISMSPETFFVELGASLHHGAIGGIALCSWKPIMLSSGSWDRRLRLWNYETETLIINKQYQEDIHGVSLHPTGLYAVVGFSDKLRYLTVLMDNFATVREFSIRNCRVCSFSRMGHIFGAVNGNVIQIYTSITFENLVNLKGHNGRVMELSWEHNDRKMTSCGSEGAIYEWDITEFKRCAETIIKTCNFNGCCITSDGKSSFGVGTDGQVREFINSNIHRDVAITPNGLDAIALSNSDAILVVSGNGGVVYSVKLPLLDVAEFNDYVVHSSRVVMVSISYDDKYLITCSADGCICIWKLLGTEGKAIKLDKEFVPSSDILISSEELEEKMASIKDLQLRMRELETEHAYQLRQNDVVHNLRMKDVHEGYCSAIEELKEKNEQLDMDHVQEINNINVEITKMKQGHEQFVEQLESNYNDKLIIEYDKFLRLEEKMGRMRMQYEKELEELSQAKENSEETITNNFLQKLEDKEVQLEELLEQMKQKTKEHELIKQQIEDDADREIYELKMVHEKELKEEQDNNIRLKGETGILKKKLIIASKEVDELKHSVYVLENEHIKFKATIIGLEKDISDLKKEIAERDATIQDKERRIFELKRKNQELEKFKFILDFKIKELKSQIEPRERQIREQTEQINDMVNELENLQKIILSLDLQLGELREKLSASDNEIKNEVARNRALKAALKVIRTDIHETSALIQDVPKLIRAVKDMYHKYNADKDFMITQAEDTEAKNEFLRQRDFLERTVFGLQSQVSKKFTSGGADKVRLVDENATLIEETNILRKGLKLEQRDNKKMQSILGLTSKYMLPKEAQKKLNAAVASREEIHEEYKQKIHAEESCIYTLKDENNRLLEKITESKMSVEEEEYGDGDG